MCYRVGAASDMRGSVCRADGVARAVEARETAPPAYPSMGLCLCRVLSSVTYTCASVEGLVVSVCLCLNVYVRSIDIIKDFSPRSCVLRP